MELFSKPVDGYTPEQREFALTLNLYSSKAYTYLRNTMGIQLPHPRTLRRLHDNMYSLYTDVVRLVHANFFTITDYIS